MAEPTAYDDRFYDEFEQETLESARVVVPLVMELLHPRSVLDIGCGRGAWLSILREHGVQVLRGMDGEYVPRDRLLIPRDAFTPTDLSREFRVDGSYDLAMCLEVAEHLPESHSRYLVRTLTSAAPVVLWSAAIPWQGGVDHINEQWPWYWQMLFQECGFTRLDPIRPRVLRDRRVGCWYRQNLLVYVSEAAIAASSTLQDELRFAADADIELIHSLSLMRLAAMRWLPLGYWEVRERIKNGVRRCLGRRPEAQALLSQGRRR